MRTAADITKPPYRVPSMREIEAVPWNGYRVASTFSGCGGSCLGYRMAGFRVVWASEFIPAAQDSYRANHPDTILDTRDIREVKAEDILTANGIKVGELDLFDGSPPCSSFSTAGKRSKGWGQTKSYSDTVQRTDDLFFEFIRLLDGLKPKVFVAENVRGLVKGVAKGYFLEIFAALQAAGYRVGCRVLDAQWLGVPQMRQRTIFIGVRDDLGIEPVYPKPLPFRYTVMDALPWVVRIGGIVKTGWGSGKMEVCDTNVSPTIMAHGGGGMSRHQFGVEVNQDTDISRFAIGKEWDRLKPGESSDRYFNLVRPHPDAPCPTICASHGHPGTASVTHPTEKRKLAIAELKRICAFPDDFVLTGTYEKQCERLGRAVPPVMMQAIANTVRHEILDKATATNTERQAHDSGCMDVPKPSRR